MENIAIYNVIREGGRSKLLEGGSKNVVDLICPLVEIG